MAIAHAGRRGESELAAILRASRWSSRIHNGRTRAAFEAYRWLQNQNSFDDLSKKCVSVSARHSSAHAANGRASFPFRVRAGAFSANISARRRQPVHAAICGRTHRAHGAPAPVVPVAPDLRGDRLCKPRSATTTLAVPAIAWSGRVVLAGSEFAPRLRFTHDDC